MATSSAGQVERPEGAPHKERCWALSRSNATELLDETGHDRVELASNLSDIRRVNQLAGGTRATLRALPALLAKVPAERPAVILDLATGSGDIPRAILGWAAKRDRQVQIIASDLSLDILDEARRHLTDDDHVSFATYDARAVPLPDQSVDVALCALALHHFTREDAVTVLREIARVSRVGFILNDITRSRQGLVSAWVASRLATGNRLTRHDMPLSVRRAFTPGELRQMLAEAGLEGAVVRQHWLFRMTAVWQAPETAS
ncbi:MAG: methyltransferase domain-containing protein [Thermomicrobiales bacterium]